VLAVDTNLIVRFLTRDDEDQFARAEAVIKGRDPIFVTLTVLLETEWVLRRGYRFNARRVTEALRAFIGLPSVVLQEAEVAILALDCAEQGLDFADALHLAQSRACDAFMTFDESLVAKGQILSQIPVRSP
jgi:predicted nucleic-acid-binding protein